MEQYISKSALVAEIEKMRDKAYPQSDWNRGYTTSCEEILSFLDTLEVKEVDSKSTDEKTIAKYLYEKKGYPIDLNGNLLSYEETIKDANQYIIYKKKQFIENACEFLKSYRQDTPDGTGYIAGIVNDKTIEDFKNFMKG